MLRNLSAISRRTLSRPPTVLARPSVQTRTPPIVPLSPRHFSRTASRSQPQYSRWDDGPSSSSSSSSGPRQDYITWMRERPVVVAGGVVLAYYLYHLEQVAETGRWRFMAVPKWVEEMIAKQEFDELKYNYEKQLLPPNHPLVAYVSSVAERILASNRLGHVKGNLANDLEDSWSGSGTSRDEWEVFVIHEDRIPNAFVMLGRKIFVFTGLMQVAKEPDTLAAVLGHEIAHQVARHPSEKLSSVQILFVLGILLEGLGLDVGLSRLLLSLLYSLPNSRKVESEADKIGLNLMSQACFEPHAAAEVWNRFAAMEQKLGRGSTLASNFTSTHPPSEARMKQILQWMPEALQIRAGSACSEYGNFMSFGQTLGGMGGIRNHNHVSPSEGDVWQV